MFSIGDDSLERRQGRVADRDQRLPGDPVVATFQPLDEKLDGGGVALACEHDRGLDFVRVVIDRREHDLGRSF
jgi:hypothetical protein